MSQKNGKIAALIASCHGQEMDAHYVGYFECFNRGLYFEEHEVLEALWLKDRQGANGAFYKGLIQLAGAFVHLKKGRLRPADVLFTLARRNLARFPAAHERLDVAGILTLIGDWQQRLEQGGFTINPLATSPPPRISLDPIRVR
jgi:predicted metal-dependent hydrolase